MEEWIGSLGDMDKSARQLQPFAQWVRRNMDAVHDFFRGLDDLQIVKLILLINAVIAVVYLLSHLSKRRWKKGLLLCVFMLAMPVVGPLYLLMAELLLAIQKLFGDREVSMEELSFDQRRVRMILDADVEKQRNVVPVEEALLVSNKNDKRTTFLEILKDENEVSLGVIRGAVENQDTEIAHYAAAYVTDMITNVKERESTLRKAFEEEPVSENCEAYVRHLFHVLDTGVFMGAEKRRYLERLDKSILWQLENSPQSCPVQDMTGVARQWMKIGDMDGAKRWIDRVRPMCYEDLDAFKACAIYEYRCHNRAALMELLENVRGSALELDSEALDWIRFFEKPAEPGE